MDNTFEKIYALARQIPRGQAATYGQLALLAGNPRLSRIVGCAMSAAPEDVPCHRVVNRLGGLSDAFRPMGRDTQRMLLEMEGVPFTMDGRVDLEKIITNTYDFQDAPRAFADFDKNSGNMLKVEIDFTKIA